jgi:hypothetical protein
MIMFDNRYALAVTAESVENEMDERAFQTIAASNLVM